MILNELEWFEHTVFSSIWAIFPSLRYTGASGWDFLIVKNLQICFSPKLASTKSQLQMYFFQFLDCLKFIFIYFSLVIKKKSN